MPAVTDDDADREWFLNGATGSLTPWRSNFPTRLLLKDPTFLEFLQKSVVATPRGLTGVLSSVHAQMLDRDMIAIKPSPDCFAEPYMGPTDHDIRNIIAIVNRERKAKFQAELAA